MRIHCGYELIFNTPAPTPMVLLLYTHPSRAWSIRSPERLHTDPPLLHEDFIDSFGNRSARLTTQTGKTRLSSHFEVEDSGLPDAFVPAARQHAVENLPIEVLPYLLASRYCEVDRLSETAWLLFNSTPPGWARVQAVCDWVHNNVTFGYHYARATKTAFEVFAERTGVCRDFTHLSITFCRALGIPARYATGYLGDIGVPANPSPMDFSAWFEVYLDHNWYTFDARHNVPRVGRVLMARGRDAVDVALTTSFGPANLEQFTVWTDELVEVGM
jgi:transglutaminase-like putative cysteine protease